MVLQPAPEAEADEVRGGADGGTLRKRSLGSGGVPPPPPPDGGGGGAPAVLSPRRGRGRLWRHRGPPPPGLLRRRRRRPPSPPPAGDGEAGVLRPLLVREERERERRKNKYAPVITIQKRDSRGGEGVTKAHEKSTTSTTLSPS